MTPQEQYWFKMMQQRQASMRAYMMYAHNLATKLAAHILAGGTLDDPGYKDDYCWLIDEFGEKFFEDELHNLMLRKEEEDNR